MFGLLSPLPAAPADVRLLSARSAVAGQIDSSISAVDFSQASVPGYLGLSGAQIVAVAIPRSADAEGSVTVRFGGKATWLYQTFAQRQNWSGTQLVMITAKNEENFPVTFGAGISSSSNPADLSVAFSAPFTLAANETRRFALVLREPEFASAGLRALPPPSGAPSTFVRSISVVDTSRIGHWRVSYQGTTPARVTFSEIDRVSYNLGFPNLVDEFGQFTGRDWTGKVTDAGDFAARKAEEAIDLTQNPAATMLYGNKAAPKLATNATWKMANIGGRKYFVTPDGVPFWMTGLTGVHDWMATMTEGRESMFRSLPSESGENADLYLFHTPVRGKAGTMFLLQRYNLRQKYGQAYKTPFVAQLKKRLPSWGINTVGTDSMEALYDNFAPFTLRLDTNAFPTRLTTPMIAWNTLPDPYASNFQAWSVANFKAALGSKATMKNLIGAFVDNEMSWGMVTTERPDGDLSVALGALNAPASQPARVALIARLQAKYALVGRLNTAWGTRFASFAAVNAGSSRPNAAMRADLSSFVGAYAGIYFIKVKAALTAAGYKGLYLGCRFNQANDPVVSAAAASVDVLSFNYYRRAADMPWAYLNGLPKPVLISEFGIGHNDGSGLGGPPAAETLDQRATWVDEWLRTAAVQPNIVGLQYFEYGEHPASGVADTQENYAYGLVDIADNPELKIIGTFRRFAKDLYSLRK